MRRGIDKIPHTWSYCTVNIQGDDEMYLLLWHKNGKHTCSAILPTMKDVEDMVSLFNTSSRVDMEKDVKVKRIETGNWVNLNTLEEEI